MPRSKEIPEDVRRKVVEAHESGKGYKLISKSIGLPKTTVRAILMKWKRFGTVMTLPRSGRPSKISLRTKREIIREVMKNPCTTSKDLQATLALSNICVHQSTIRRILGIHGRPTLSSFEGNMALETASGQQEEGVFEASDGLSQSIKNEEEQQGLNNNSDNGTTKSSDNGENKKENCDNETPSANLNGTGGGDVETTSTNHKGDMHRDGTGESEKCSDGGNKTMRKRGGGAAKNKKRDVVTAVVDNGQSGGRDVSDACSNNNNNNNNNNGGNWSEGMDYVSTLIYS